MPSTNRVAPLRFIYLHPYVLPGRRANIIQAAETCASLAGQGHEVCLVSGPVNLATPAGVGRVDVETAAEMHAAVSGRVATVDIAVFAAAVADFRVARVLERKWKKTDEGGVPSLELEPTPDILGSMREPFGFEGGTDVVVTLGYESIWPGLAFGRTRLGLASMPSTSEPKLPLAQGRWFEAGPLDIESGEQTPLQVPLFDPRWSPDMKRVVGFNFMGMVTIVDLATQRAKAVENAFGQEWHPDGKHVYYVVQKDEEYALRRAAVGGDENEDTL